MPELPEVETTLRQIKPHIVQQQVHSVDIYFPHLRFPILPDLNNRLQGQVVRNVTRRGKYLLFKFGPEDISNAEAPSHQKTLILHLGMSGHLRFHKKDLPRKKHDHVDIRFANGTFLRYTDPRRFGAILYTEEDPEKHPLLTYIGIEPLTPAFNGAYLWKVSRGKKVAVKTFLMNSKIVAGIGNIYATEALFNAHIHPKKSAGKISLEKYEALAKAIKMILKQAIKKGGTTLKDFTTPSGRSGYFSIELQVYGREGQPCSRCKTKLKSLRLNGRATVYCPNCQK